MPKSESNNYTDAIATITVVNDVNTTTYLGLGAISIAVTLK